MTSWDILGILAVIFLIISLFIGKNAIWGGLAIGIVVAILGSLIRVLNGKVFTFLYIRRVLTCAILMAVLMEILSRIADKASTKRG